VGGLPSDFGLRIPDFMKPCSFMLIAGEPSGDMLAAELVQALRQEFAEAKPVPTMDYQPLHTSLAPRFFGAGGPRMAAAGVELAFDMTRHSVVGIFEVLKNYRKFRRLFSQLYELALDRQPDAIICVDFSGFNRRFAHAVQTYARSRSDWFHDWAPRLIQYVSPQVWASRQRRAYQVGRDYDLLLSIFPFEKEWYAKRIPEFRVEFVGHPVVDRYEASVEGRVSREGKAASLGGLPAKPASRHSTLLLLPGSRAQELKRHLPVIVGALALIRASLRDVRALMVLPNDALVRQAKAFGLPSNIEVRTDGLPESLAEADVAIASTGTVTMECAFFGVPTVALYKTSWSTYQVARRVVSVKYIAMPNLLANEQVFPEFIQDAATPENLSRATLELLQDENRRAHVKVQLAEIVRSLGGPGASRRAARAVIRLLDPSTSQS
jgi:lipid-A-disaccharide synthase